jgi:polar amino acid transport system substrate-binding protein
MRKRLPLFSTIVAITALGLALSACGGQGNSGPGPAASGGSESRLEQIREKGQMRAGWAEFHPYFHLDPKTSEVSGANVDLFNDVAADMKAHLTLVEDKWPTIVLGLNSGKYDATLVGISDQRAKQADFTKPLYQTDFTFVVHSNSEYRELKDVDIKGKTIAVTTGSNTDEELSKVIKNAEILRLRDVAGVLLALKNGTADAMATTRDYMAVAVEKDPGLRLFEGKFGVSPWAFAIPKGDPEFLNYLNDRVVELKKSGKIDKILKKYNFVGVQVSPL